MLNYAQHLNIVLLEPEIPGNTGSIGRLCVGLDATLTLIEPLGFSLEDKYMRRAGLDYWPHLMWKTQPNWQAFLAESQDFGKRYYYSTKTSQPYTRASYQLGDFLIFGKETKGLPDELLQAAGDAVYTVPMYGKIRSHNLANSVSVVSYEAMRQIKDGF